MSDKSYVTMEQQACVVCCKAFDTGAILLDKRMRERFDRTTVTGYGLCPEHEKMRSDGFVALVECDPAKSGNPRERLQPGDAYRTGNIAHMKREAFERVMNVPVPERGVCFVEPGVLDKLKAMQS